MEETADGISDKSKLLEHLTNNNGEMVGDIDKPIESLKQMISISVQIDTNDVKNMSLGAAQPLQA